jgi:rubrerythrin
MSPTHTKARIYERHSRAADRGSWSVERDVAWDRIDPALAHRHPEVLDQVREAAIVESFHPVNLGRLMRATWDDLDAGVVFSLEAFEGFKHFHSLRRYLEVVDHRPRITDAELVEVRRAGAPLEIRPEELIGRLVDFMLSEHLAAYFFRRLGDRSDEPVLRDLLRRIAADEVRHAQSASDLLAKRIEADPALVPEVLEAAAEFRHYGEEVVPELPVALEGDEIAIVTFAQRVERLCGVRLVEHMKANL